MHFRDDRATMMAAIDPIYCIRLMQPETVVSLEVSLNPQPSNNIRLHYHWALKVHIWSVKTEGPLRTTPPITGSAISYRPARLLDLAILIAGGAAHPGHDRKNGQGARPHGGHGRRRGKSPSVPRGRSSCARSVGATVRTSRRL